MPECTDSRDCCGFVGQYTDHFPNPECDCKYHPIIGRRHKPVSWITGPPTPEQVAEHARQYPFGGAHGTSGLWLLARSYPADPAGPHITELELVEGTIVGYSQKRFRYLPLTAEGLPVDYVALKAVAEAAKGFDQAARGFQIGSGGLMGQTVMRLRAALKELEGR